MNKAERSWDVIVCGAGSSGMPAAIFAARRGARVLLIDAADEVGGTLHLAGGHMSAAGTRLQEARGIHDSPDEHYQDVMRISRGTANPELLRLAVDNAADTVHWLLDLGFEASPECPAIVYGHEAYSIPRTYYGREKAISILKVVRPELLKMVADGDITLELRTKVKALRVEGDRVTGIEVMGPDGNMRTEIGRNIVLSTGGYAANEAMFQRFSGNYPLFTQAYPYSQGNGFQMVLDLGGEVRYGEYFLPTYGRVKDPKDPSRIAHLTVMTPQSRQPWEIHVNLDGERFGAEDDPSPDSRERTLMRQRDLTFWVIYDEAIRRQAPDLFINISNGDLEALWNKNPSFVRSDSLVDFAARTGLSKGSLMATIDGYNASVAANKDSLGRKHLPLAIGEAPYYAVMHHGISVIGFAGIRVSPDLRVMRRDGTTMKNLYAAGEMLGSAMKGNSFASGMAVTPALTFGRLLGSRILQWADQSLAAE